MDGVALRGKADDGVTPRRNPEVTICHCAQETTGRDRNLDLPLRREESYSLGWEGSVCE